VVVGDGGSQWGRLKLVSFCVSLVEASGTNGKLSGTCVHVSIVCFCVYR